MINKLKKRMAGVNANGEIIYAIDTNQPIFKKSYDSFEDLYDYERDMLEALSPDFNDKANIIPSDWGPEHGKLVISIDWEMNLLYLEKLLKDNANDQSE